MLDELRRRLRTLREGSLGRRLTPPAGVDFSSNDYFGLSDDLEFAQACVHSLGRLASSELFSPSSRLLRGHRESHRRFETRFAAFKGDADALLFPSGFQANIGLLTALVSEDDRVLSDERNHASIIDGLRLSRCQKAVFHHLDLNQVEQLLSQPHNSGRTLLVTESLFSMEGDIAPLAQYADLARRYGAELIVDDAHATGLYGKTGAGLVEAAGIQGRPLATLSTLGKVFGLSGGVVSGSETLVDYLINTSRSFIYSTAVPPLLVAALETALDVVSGHPERRERVHRNAENLRRLLRESGLLVGGCNSPIVPVVVGDSGTALQMAQHLQIEGYDVRAIRPPTVPEDRACLRLSVHASHTRTQIQGLAAAIASAATSVGCQVAQVTS